MSKPDRLTPEERLELRARLRAADEADALLFLAAQLESDLAEDGMLLDDDDVDIEIASDDAVVASIAPSRLP